MHVDRFLIFFSFFNSQPSIYIILVFVFEQFFESLTMSHSQSYPSLIFFLDIFFVCLKILFSLFSSPCHTLLGFFLYPVTHFVAAPKHHNRVKSDKPRLHCDGSRNTGSFQQDPECRKGEGKECAREEVREKREGRAFSGR